MSFTCVILAQGCLIVLRSHRVDAGTPVHGWATLSYKIAILASSPILLVKDKAA